MTWKYFRSQLRPQPQIEYNEVVLFKVLIIQESTRSICHMIA